MLRVAVLLLLLAPAGASAATVGAFPGIPSEGKVPGTGPSVSFRAAPGELNAVAVTADAEGLVFRDTGAPLTPSGSCVAVSPNEVRCQDVGPLSVDLGDGSDRITIEPALRPGLVVFGGDGDDEVQGAQGFVTDLGPEDTYRLLGGPGNDTITGGPLDDVIDGGTGRDVLRGGGGRDRLAGGTGADELHGDAGDDVLAGDPRGGAVLDDAQARAFDAALVAADLLDGGEGRDRASWDTSAAVQVDLADPAPDGRRGEGDVLQAVEDLTGGRGRNALFGDGAANRLEGVGSGRQDLRGRGAGDQLRGRDREGQDVALSGGAGDDVLDGAAKPSCGAGRDVVDTTEVVGDCERVQLGGFTLGLRPRVRGRDVLLDLRREQTAIVAPQRTRRRLVQLSADVGLVPVAFGTRSFPRAGTTRLQLTAAGRRRLSGRNSLAVTFDDIALILRR